MKPSLPIGKENFQQEIFEIDLMDSELKYQFFLQQLEYSVLNDRIFEGEQTGLLFYEGKRCWLSMRPLEAHTETLDPVPFNWVINGTCFNMEGIFGCPDSKEKLIHRPIKELYEMEPKEFWEISEFDRFIWSEQEELASAGVKH